MTSGQWDLNALEALEREALGTFEIIEIPERLCSKLKQPTSILTTTATVSNNDMVELELQDHIKHCSCSCNHMGYGNFMDYQPTGIDKHLELSSWKCRLHHIQSHDLSESTTFGDLPDVTEHSYNPTVLPDSISNTELSITTSQRSSTPHCHQNLSNCNSNNNNSSSRDRDRDHHSNTNISSSLTNLNSNGQQHPSHYNTNKKTKHQPATPPPHHKKPIRKFNYFLFLILLFLFVIIIILISITLKYFFGGYKLDRNSHEQRISLVEHILRNTPLIDGHNDLPWNIRRFAHNRLEYVNFTHGLDKIEPWYRSPWSQTDLPRMKQGLIGAQFWSAYVPCEAQGLDAVQLTLEQIDLIIRLIEANYRDMKLVTTTSNIISTHTNGLISSLIGVEGGHCIGSSLGVLRSMYALGVRYLTLTHTCDTSWAGTADSTDKGLSPFGRAIIKEMNRLGMIIDLSHTSDATAKDVFETTRAPVIYSHSAARTLCNLTRNIGDDFLRKIAENGGIVMVSFYSLHVACGKSATISDVIAHINYIRSVAGVQHVGLGAGYDGIDSTPQGLENVSKYPNLFSKLLEDPSWTEESLSLLAGKNFLRVFESVENVRDYLKRADIHPYENLEPPKRSPCTYTPS